METVSYTILPLGVATVSLYASSLYILGACALPATDTNAQLGHQNTSPEVDRHQPTTDTHWPESMLVCVAVCLGSVQAPDAAQRSSMNITLLYSYPTHYYI